MLMLHCGAHHVARADLKRLWTPEPTPTWTPVPHAEVANRIVAEAERRNLEITSERWGLMDGGFTDQRGQHRKVEGARLYGALDFGPVPGYETPEGVGLSMGISTSIDKTGSQRILAGARVFVCDNGALIGEFVIRHIHGRKFDLDGSIQEAFEQFFQANLDMTAMHDRLQAESLTENDTKARIVDLAVEGAVASRNILQVYDEWQSPSHDDFKPRNAWSLYNCTTQVMKRYSPIRQVEGFRALNRVMVPSVGADQN